MPSVDQDRATPAPLKPIFVFGVLALALALRIAHISSAMLSPLSFQPGPDEDYYLRFGQAVAAGHGQLSPEFMFMDPAYGYLLGGIFRILGVNLFAVYVLQALLDTATAYGIYLIGARLGRPRAGLYGSMLYAVTATAIMFSATMLKEICVTSYLTWWIVGALAVIRTRSKPAWLAFGLYCGIGVALRSNLLLMGLFAVTLPLFGAPPKGASIRAWASLALPLLAGIALALLPWSLRNAQAGDGLSPLPHNGGIVLHQVYNEANPGSSIWIPGFVNYLHPSEIWRGYEAETSRRLGRPVTPAEVDHYWRDQALGFIKDHPGDVLRDVLHKSLAFLSVAEIPNNRSSVEERMFSPVLRALPRPVAWLLALGLAGLLWLALEDRRWPIVAAPILLSWAVVAFFWAEDRFRFHAMGALAACAGVWLDHLVETLRESRRRLAAGFIACAGLIAAVSVWLGSNTPAPVVRWDHIVWGYLKMGRNAEAAAIAERVIREQPDNASVLEAAGVIAASRGQYPQAHEYLQRALVLRPASHVGHYNLARVYLAEDDREHAAEEARIALRLNPAPEYQDLLNQIESPRQGLK
ncbi:MAG: glycosyltransferase family 39 protein [Steroidobacterales bacterium]